MRRLWLVILLLTPATAGAAPNSDPSFGAPLGPVTAKVSVCFVPAQVCDIAIATAIDAARSSIRVQAYGFTSHRILAALAAAHARGVDVQVILDKSDEHALRRGRVRRSGAAFTDAAGIPTWIDDKVAIAHNKLIIIDRHLVVGGSYNYTASAEHRNAENATFIDSTELAERYLENWESRRLVSRAWNQIAAGTRQ